MNKHRTPPQDYTPLFDPEQIEAIRRAKRRAGQDPGGQTEPPHPPEAEYIQD